MTRYMKHSLLGTRMVISSIITHNLSVTRSKQPLTIGTNRMCISRDDNRCAITMCFPRQLLTTARKLLLLQKVKLVQQVKERVRGDTSCPIGKLPFSFLLCDELHNTCFLSMPQLSMYVSIRPNERFRKVLQSTWRQQNLHAAILRPPAKRIQMKLYESHLGKEKPIMGNIEPVLGITKPAEGLNKPCQVDGRKYFAAEGFNLKIPFITKPIIYESCGDFLPTKSY